MRYYIITYHVRGRIESYVSDEIGTFERITLINGGTCVMIDKGDPYKLNKSGTFEPVNLKTK